MAKVKPRKVASKSNKQNAVIFVPKETKLNQEQLNEFGERLSYMLDSYTDRFTRSSVTTSEHITYSRTSKIIRWFLMALFVCLGIWIIGELIINWKLVLTTPFSLSALLAGIMLFGFGVACFVIAFDIRKENSKSYIISLFSAVVAVVALIVTLMK